MTWRLQASPVGDDAAGLEIGRLPPPLRICGQARSLVTMDFPLVEKPPGPTRAMLQVIAPASMLLA